MSNCGRRLADRPAPRWLVALVSVLCAATICLMVTGLLAGFGVVNKAW